MDTTALWITFVALVSAPALAAPRQKGSPYFHTCRHRARVWDDCVATTAQGLRPLFVDGIPELGVRPIDPLFAEEIHFSEASGKFRVNLKMTNVTMEGFKDYVVTGVRSDLQELTLEISLRVPRLDFRARYHMDGRFLFLALSGDGTCQYNLTDVENVFLVKGHLVRRVSDDALHFRVASLRWTMRPRRGSFRFSAPEGEPSLYSQATSRLLNEQAEESWASFQDAVQRGFAEIFRERINRLMMNIPYRHLFPAGVLPLHLLEVPMDDNEADEYPPLEFTRPPTTSTTSTTTTAPTTTTTTTSFPSTTSTTTTPSPTTISAPESTTAATTVTTTTTETTSASAPTTNPTTIPTIIPTTIPTTTPTTTTPPTTASFTTSTTTTTLHADDGAPFEEVVVGPSDGDTDEVQNHDEAHSESDEARLREQVEAVVVQVDSAARGEDAVGDKQVDEAPVPDTTSLEPDAGDAHGEDIASFDTAFTLIASSSPSPLPPPTSAPPLEDVVFVDKGQEKRTEYVVVESDVAETASSAATPPQEVRVDTKYVAVVESDAAETASSAATPPQEVRADTKHVAVVESDAAETASSTAAPQDAPEDTTEADNNIPTGVDEDEQLALNRDLRGAEASLDAANATEAADASLSLAALGQAVGEVAKDILAEAAEVLLEAWRGDPTTTAGADESTTLSPQAA